MAWALPFPCGGPDLVYEQELQALLDEYEVIGDTSRGTELEIEARGEAVALTIMRKVGRRSANQHFPRRMIESLAEWEEIVRVRPNADDGDNERRRRVGARMKGYTSNRPQALDDACRELLGNMFVRLVRVAPADEIVYWPGVNPGPPGFEYSTNRCHFGVVVTRDALTEAGFTRKVDHAFQLLGDMVPDYNTFAVGVDDGALADEAVVGVSLL